MTPIQRMKRLREHHPSMSLVEAKRIVDAGEDDAMVAGKEAERRIRDAAPDLFEALTWLLQEFEAYRDDPEGLFREFEVYRVDPEGGMWPEAMEQARYALEKARGDA